MATTVTKKKPEDKTKTQPQAQAPKPPATQQAQPPAKVLNNVPDFMRGDAGKGTENLSSGDYEMPRIKLMQGLSEELQAYDGLKAGDFFHSLAEVNLNGTVDVVPLYISKRFVLWRPRHDGGGILARSDDAVHWQPPSGEFEIRPSKDQDRKVKWKLAPTVAGSRLDQWGTYDPSNPNSQPAATLAYVIVVALPQHPELSPVALLLQRTAVSPARKLMGKLKISQAPCFGMRFEMSSFVDDRNGQKFNNYRFTASGFVTDVDEYNVYKGYHEQFSKTGVNVKDLESAQDEQPEGDKRDADAAAAGEGKF